MHVLDYQAGWGDLANLSNFFLKYDDSVSSCFCPTRWFGRSEKW